MARNHRRIARAFTLIELLVTISIIAILMSVLLPALGAVRTLARRTQNNANLRSNIQGCHMFATDHKEFLPPGQNEVYTTNGGGLGCANDSVWLSWGAQGAPTTLPVLGQPNCWFGRCADSSVSAWSQSAWAGLGVLVLYDYGGGDGKTLHSPLETLEWRTWRKSIVGTSAGLFPTLKELNSNTTGRSQMHTSFNYNAHFDSTNALWSARFGHAADLRTAKYGSPDRVPIISDDFCRATLLASGTWGPRWSLNTYSVAYLDGHTSVYHDANFSLANGGVAGSSAGSTGYQGSTAANVAKRVLGWNELTGQ